MFQKINWGFINIRINRVKVHVQTINFLMIFSLFIDNNGWHLWYLIVPVILLAVSFFDHKKVLPQELDHYYKVSPTFQGLLKDVAEIKKVVNDGKNRR